MNVAEELRATPRARALQWRLAAPIAGSLRPDQQKPSRPHGPEGSPARRSAPLRIQSSVAAESKLHAPAIHCLFETTHSRAAATLESSKDTTEQATELLKRLI